MDLEKYITDNSVLIIPNNLKIKVIKYLNSLDKILNIKILTFDELKKNLLFDYNTKTINYIIKNNNVDYNNALELISNMYYLFEDNYDNKKIDNLNDLKKELLDNKLLILDPYFKESILNKNIYIYGFDYLTKYQLKLIDMLPNHTIIPKENNNYNHLIYNFEHLNYEIEFIINDILNKKLDLNHVYIYGINNDNSNTIKRVFSNYNININLTSKTSLYDTKMGLEFLSNLDNYEQYLETIKDPNIKDLIINILNKYYWINNKIGVLDMLKQEFINTYIPTKKRTNSVNEINIFDNIFNDDDYVYIISFNNEYIPNAYKDTDFINDNEKFNYLETTEEKNIIEKEKWFKAIKNIKNLTITSSNQNYLTTLTPSSLINDYNYEVINKEFIPSNYSNKSNLYNLGILLDNYQKHNLYNKNIPNLITTYPNHNYNNYDNKYQSIILKNNFKYSLSYSKMNTFFECPFKYYCDNILKLSKFEETFDTYIGSLCHYILSNIYNDDFDYEKAKDDFISNHPFELTNANAFFLNKILNELRTTIDYIKGFQNITKYQHIETEKSIKTTIDNIEFNGIIDKIMHYDNNVVLVDYKTGTPDIDLRLVSHGLNLQLPTYIYLIKQIYPESNVVGIYLEHILMPNFNEEKDTDLKTQYQNSLKLTGYSLGNEQYLKDFDSTYENSEYIKGLKLTSNGWSHYSKVLTEKEFNDLVNLTEEKITECINNVNNAAFDITPKYLGIKNISCDYCPYQSVCFKTEKDNVYLKLDNSGGDENEMD